MFDSSLTVHLVLHPMGMVRSSVCPWTDFQSCFHPQCHDKSGIHWKILSTYIFPRSQIDDQTRLGLPSSCLVAGTEETVAPQAMMMENGRIMVKRNHDSKAVIHLLHNGTTTKYANCLLWSPWQQLEDIATDQEEEETDAQKNTRLTIYPMSVFPCVEEEDWSVFLEFRFCFPVEIWKRPLLL